MFIQPIHASLPRVIEVLYDSYEASSQASTSARQYPSASVAACSSSSPANTVVAHWVLLSEKGEATRTDAAPSVVYLPSVET